MMAKRFSIKSAKGFSLMELIITLTLLSIVLAGIYTLYFYVQTGFNMTDARSEINHQMNFAFMQMTNDIRSASKPNNETMSVRVVSQYEMLIYTQNKESKYIVISYKINTEKKILQRGWVECATEIPPEVKNPSYGIIENWETVMAGVLESASIPDGDYTSCFLDITDADTNERREISITLIGNDSNRPLNRPIVSVKTLTSRSKGSP